MTREQAAKATIINKQIDSLEDFYQVLKAYLRMAPDTLEWCVNNVHRREGGTVTTDGLDSINLPVDVTLEIIAVIGKYKLRLEKELEEM